MHIAPAPRRAALGAFVLCAVVASGWAQTERPAKPPAPAPKNPPSAGDPAAREYVLLTTGMGDILLELDGEKAPISTANFLEYVKSDFYDKTIFHRVISNFMIQGGGFTADMTQKPTRATIKNEWQNGLKNTRGSIAMARLGNQADSASSQFFINVQDNPGLDQPNDGAGYAVFGKVVAGLDVVDKIRAVPTTTRSGHQNVPTEPVVVSEAKQLTEKEAKDRIAAAKKPAG